MAKTFLPPGFRFHPTDIELVWYYLKRKIMGKPFRFEAISEVELYKFAPWDLPDKSCLRSKDLEWYFFCPRDRKYSQGSRTNRATDIGYWKTTGKDRSIVHNTRTVGMKKTLIFHLGKAPQGSRTDWVMYEFRLKSEELVNARSTQDSYVICKIFQKSGPGPRNGEQYGAPFKEEDWEDDADIEDAGSFPSTSATEHAHFFENVPQQAVVAPEVGVTSSLLSNFEVGEPSSVLSNVEVREPFSVISNVKVGEPSSVLSNVEVGEPSSVLSNVEVREPFSVISNVEVGEPSSVLSNVEVGEPSSVLSNVEVGEPSSVLSNVQVREPFSVICNVEVGEQSSVPSNVEVGEASSCVPELSAIRELSSMQGFPDVDEPSHVPEPFFADGILLDQLEAVLNSCPTHPESANDEMFNSAILHDDDTPVPGVDFENIYDLIDLSSRPLPEPTEGTALCDSVGFDDELHPLLAEFANEHYVELSDIGFVGEWNPFLAPVDYHYPPANDGSYGLGNIYPDNALDPYIVSESELTGFADDQFPSTFEDHHLT